MKRVWIYTVVVAAALLLPVEKTDVGQLLPVEVVLVGKEADEVTIETDTGDIGRGETVAGAIQNLRDTSPGVIFLDTADYLLIRKEAEHLAKELTEYLKKGTRICWVQGKIELEAAAQYLAIHQPSWKLKDLEKLKTMEVLTISNGRMKMVEKST